MGDTGLDMGSCWFRDPEVDFESNIYYPANATESSQARRSGSAAHTSSTAGSSSSSTSSSTSSGTSTTTSALDGLSPGGIRAFKGAATGPRASGPSSSSSNSGFAARAQQLLGKQGSRVRALAQQSGLGSAPGAGSGGGGAGRQDSSPPPPGQGLPPLSPDIPQAARGLRYPTFISSQHRKVAQYVGFASEFISCGGERVVAAFMAAEEGTGVGAYKAQAVITL